MKDTPYESYGKGSEQSGDVRSTLAVSLGEPLGLVTAAAAAPAVAAVPAAGEGTAAVALT